MTIFFSASTLGFYDDGIHSTLPSDAREISADVHIQLLEAQTGGALIAANNNGDPIATTRPGPTETELIDALRVERDRLLAASDRTQFADAPLTDAEREAWRVYRQALRNLPETISDPANVVWPVAPA
jgi:hypothetical protein